MLLVRISSPSFFVWIFLRNFNIADLSRYSLCVSWFPHLDLPTYRDRSRCSFLVSCLPHVFVGIISCVMHVFLDLFHRLSLFYALSSLRRCFSGFWDLAAVYFPFASLHQRAIYTCLLFGIAFSVSCASVQFPCFPQRVSTMW